MEVVVGDADHDVVVVVVEDVVQVGESLFGRAVRVEGERILHARR